MQQAGFAAFIATFLTMSAAKPEPPSMESPAQAHTLSSPVDTAGEESFAWGSYEGPEGKRRYKLYVPPRVNAGKRRMIVMLHGCTQDPDDFARGTRMNEIARRKGFVVLYPEQPVSANPLKSWNWFASANQQRDKGEPAILVALVDRVIDEQRIDSSSVYLAGISAGGAMAAILGATYPERFSAIALHSGIAYALVTDMSQALAAMRTPSGDAATLGARVTEAMGQRKKLIPVMIVQGTADPSVNEKNASLLTAQWLAANSHTGATARAVRVKSDGSYPVSRTTYRTIKRRTLVDLWMIEGLAHAWSGGSKQGTYTDEKGHDITSEIVRFFVKTGNPAR